MISIPGIALSVRQPWAHAIIHAGKDIENRGWRRDSPATAFRGRVAIHAAKGMTREEYYDARDFMAGLGVTCPSAAELDRGGIIGCVDVVDMVRSHPSPWFVGPVGLVLRNPQACRFAPAVGALGFFHWKPGDESIVPVPARWMLQGVSPAKQMDLL